MIQYMLDTNTVSDLIKGHQVVSRRVAAVPMASLRISSITAGELRYGLAKRPQATKLHRVVREFLLRVDVVPWDGATATQYGSMRASLEQRGRVLPPLDLLIAAHARAMEAVLVSNDRAFRQVPDLCVENWTV